MKIIFFGTSAFAARILSLLIEKKFNIVAIVTRPDRPKGRSLFLSPPPVKKMAEKIESNIPLHQPVKASAPEFAEILKQYDADLFLVVAYGEIIKQNLLAMPKKGCINIHASLLPKYRGAAPMQRALMDGVTETGITIIDMVLQMDAGDMLEIEKVAVSHDMTHGELEEELYQAACKAVLRALDDIEKGDVRRTPQNAAEVTFAPKITAEESEIDWKLPAKKIHNTIRALSPTPGAWCFVEVGGEKKRLKILRSSLIDVPTNALGVVVCGEGTIKILEVQLEGKKALAADVFFRGARDLKFL